MFRFGSGHVEFETGCRLTVGMYELVLRGWQSLCASRLGLFLREVENNLVDRHRQL